MAEQLAAPPVEDWRRVVSDADAQRFHDLGWWRETTALDEFLGFVESQPQKAAVVSYRRGEPFPTVVTFGQLGHLVDRFACAFGKLGVRQGDIVTIHLPNTWQFPALAMGAMRAGAIPNPVPHIYREHELSFMLRHARSKVYVVQSEFRGFSYRELGSRLKGEIASLEHVISIGGTGDDDVIDFDDFFLSPLHEQEPGAREQLEMLRPGPDDPAFLLFTSGTTGRPKAALHSHNTSWSAGRPLPEAVGLHRDDVCFMASTVGHLTGFYWGTYLPLSMGQKVVYQDEWNAGQMMDIIDVEGITWTLSATPFAMDMIKAQKEHPRPIPSLRAFVCGGATIPPQAAVDMQETLGVDLVSLWGMTEVGICSIHQSGAPLETLTASDGMPVPHMEVRIVDEEQKPVPDGEEGRLQARGPSIILGYRGQPEMTRAACMDGGWFETGDLGRRAPDGGIRITGRSKDIIIRGGQNVPVVEMENLLAEHPRVATVAVVAYPDDRLGERACAFIVPEGTAPTLPELTAHLQAAGLTKQFWPERMEVVDALPRTPAGKIQKFVLRDRLAGR